MESVSPELLRGNVITTRIRLARNLKDYPFYINDQQKAKEIVKKVNRALVKCDTFNLFYVSNLDKLFLETMKDKHLISQNLIDNPLGGAVLINTSEDLSIMINEEDVIREQCFMKGLCLSEAYRRLDKIDDELSKYLDIAYDDRFGYLTACPTNMGTGLRASVMMFLPALSMTGKIGELVEEVSRLGLTVRGAFGEGSQAEGYMYQISNEVTLGVSENEIIRSVEETVLQICNAERELAEKLFLKKDLKAMDKAKKSFGVLTNAVLLSYSEFLEHIANVKIGAMMGFLPIKEIEELDDLIVMVRPAVLSLKYGKKLSATDRDLFRAEVVGQKLLKIKE